MQTLEHKSGVVEIYDDKLVIKKKGSFFTMRSGSEKIFYFDDIRSLEKNRTRPLYDNAFIQIDIGGSGGGKQGGSLLDNAIPFSTNQEMEDAYEVLSAILNDYQTKKKSATTNTPQSSADELKKFKELLDLGAISQEEFDAKKKELLGL